MDECTVELMFTAPLAVQLEIIRFANNLSNVAISQKATGEVRSQKATGEIRSHTFFSRRSAFAK